VSLRILAREISTMNFSSHLNHPLFKTIGKIADENGQPAFAIGGFVRDLIIQRPCKDIDIVVEGSGIELAKKSIRSVGRRQSDCF
jgi:poly(A) polymerase